MSSKGKPKGPRSRNTFTEANVLTVKPRDKEAKKWVEKLAKAGRQWLIWDEGTGAARGLAILVSPSGTRSYRCAYYFPGSPTSHYKHLGRVGVISLEQAREECRKAQGLAKQGEDPKSADPGKADNFETAIEDYTKLEQRGRRENKSAEATKKVMLSSCSAWKKRPVTSIRSQEIEHLLAEIRDGNEEKGLRPRPYLANRLYSHLKHFFNWCVKRKRLTASPMQGMELPWTKAKPRERDWFKGKAGDAAIKALWKAAEDIGGVEGRYVKMLLLTGKRKTALASMRWEEITEDWFWDAPASTVKNKRLNGVPLPALAQRVLHPRQEQGRVFGSINLDKLQKKVRAASGIHDFFWHGTRHLAETKTAELRDEGRSLILPHVRDLLFDHVPQRGSGAGYDHHDYIAEMRDAMEAWASHVERLVSPGEGVAKLR